MKIFRDNEIPMSVASGRAPSISHAESKATYVYKPRIQTWQTSGVRAPYERRLRKGALHRTVSRRGRAPG